MPKGDFWTEEETARGRDLVERGVGHDEFLQIMGRSRSSFFSHVGVKRRRERLERAMKTGIDVSRLEVPQEILDDAKRRLSAERTITASFFGDPGPGQSALDKLFTEGQRG